MRKGIVKRYTRDGITLVWKPDLCIHSTRCFQGLPAVFNPSRRPWVDLEGADLTEVVRQVQACPSGALSIADLEPEPSGVVLRVEVIPGGPLAVSGDLMLKLADGSEQPCSGKTALCRCGASDRKPFCDGSHRRIGFAD